MSIRNSMKWFALAGVGMLVSGCVAAPTSYSPGNVPIANSGFSDVAPGNFVADPSYAGGGYYEVVEVYEDPFYNTDPFYSAPQYGTFGTSVFLHSHSGYSHRHHDGHLSHSSHPEKKKEER